MVNYLEYRLSLALVNSGNCSKAIWRGVFKERYPDEFS